MLPFAFVGHLAGLVVEGAVAVHLALLPLAGVDAALAVVEGAVALAQVVQGLALVLARF